MRTWCLENKPLCSQSASNRGSALEGATYTTCGPCDMVMYGSDAHGAALGIDEVVPRPDEAAICKPQKTSF